MAKRLGCQLLVAVSVLVCWCLASVRLLQTTGSTLSQVRSTRQGRQRAPAPPPSSVRDGGEWLAPTAIVQDDTIANKNNVNNDNRKENDQGMGEAGRQRLTPAGAKEKFRSQAHGRGLVALKLEKLEPTMPPPAVAAAAAGSEGQRQQRREGARRHEPAQGTSIGHTLAGVEEARGTERSRTRLAVLVKTGPRNRKRRDNVRENWLDDCSVGRLNRRKKVGAGGTGVGLGGHDATAAMAESLRWQFDHLALQRSLGERYYAVEGHAYRKGDFPSPANSAGENLGGDGGELETVCVFVTGRAQSKAERSALEAEMKLNGDLLMADISDRYETMTAKTIWMMQWSLEVMAYDYVMLIDDDATVIWSQFVPLALESKRTGLYCGHQHLWTGVKHCEDDTAGRMLKKNCVSWQQYDQSEYPKFASGFGYFMSRDVISGVVRAGIMRMSTPGLPGNVEDAMVSVLANDTGVQLTPSHRFLHWEHDGQEAKRCRDNWNDQPVVIGNAPQYVLNTLTYNGKNRKHICMGAQ